MAKEQKLPAGNSIRDRVKELRRVPASQLKANSKNWRTHPKEQRDALRAVLDQIGFAGACLARELPDKSLELIDGHLRTEDAGDAPIPVLILDVTEQEADLLLATFDPLSAMAQSDAAQLQQLLSGLKPEGAALESMLRELAAKNPLPITDAPAGIDDIPEPPKKPITKPGDLWILGNHRLLCGDSTKEGEVRRLLEGQKAEMMHADPPYGVDYEGGHFHSGDVTIVRKREKLHSDDSTDIYGKFLAVAMKVVDGPCYVWFADRFAREVLTGIEDAGGKISAILIWHKTNATYAAMNAQYKCRHEPCLYFKSGRSLRWIGPSDASTLLEYKREGSNKLHPTQKPVDLVQNFLKNHDSKTVFDPFSGSGTTIVAAEIERRRCFAIEISPGYCDVTVSRWEKLTGKKATLEKPKRSKVKS